ncbi:MULTISPECIES: MauE/DoxX family redox-associated membrane protein [Flavobacterium]|uniref:MauE/DoxX family redox-associated membrane protein n=1 Tax=Flavobacterium TaxID=237 RepID=UPI0021158D08|nr:MULTISPECIES: MauE/DoxX family redox-associated membrane protein [Flavobacterium]UUF12598.1 hypothetical protein NLJ00_15185 [Flavobacterium panici]
MYSNSTIKGFLIQSASLLYVLLFVYAAVSKLIDFERFQVQLAQSPILSAYADLISYVVIIVEFAISGLLIFKRTSTIGMLLALWLMTMFTSYIFIVLNYSSFVPCSCGGILEKMTWKVHLIFNLIFTLLALLALFLQIKTDYKKRQIKNKVMYVASIILSMFGCVLFVAGLFWSSEQIIHHKNPFIRRYPKDAVSFLNSSDLIYNSYYFAGSENQKVYLSNYSDPLHLLAIDLLGKKEKIKLYLKNKDLPFRSPKIVVRDKQLYLMDGTVPCILIGSTDDWELNNSLTGVPLFTTAQPIDSSKIVLRNIDAKNMRNNLCLYDREKKDSLRNFPDLLQKQIDGIFDTDGMLLFNEELNLAIYTYFYRNQFFAFDQDGNKRISGTTIDTTATAKIKVAQLRNGNEWQMAAPPLKVNSKTATTNDLLFIKSKIPGRFENENMWKKSSIIDVYNLQTKAYVLSFYIQERPDQKMHNFFVTSTHLYVLAGTKLQIYSLGKLLKDEMKIATVQH